MNKQFAIATDFESIIHMWQSILLLQAAASLSHSHILKYILLQENYINVRYLEIRVKKKIIGKEAKDDVLIML